MDRSMDRSMGRSVGRVMDGRMVCSTARMFRICAMVLWIFANAATTGQITGLAPTAAARTVNFMTPTLQFRSGQESGLKRSFECEGSSVILECQDSMLVHIKTAVYTLPPFKMCETGSDHVENAVCSTRAQDIVERQCNRKQNCIVWVESATFGSTCEHSMPKILAVEYTCENPIPRSTVSLSIVDAISNTMTAARLPLVQTTTTTVRRTTPTLPWVEMCPSLERRQIVWPMTPAGVWASGVCPNNEQAVNARWQCGQMARWLGQPDLSNCTSPAAAALRTRVTGNKGRYNAGEVKLVAQKLREFSSQPQPVYGGDVSTLTFVMHELIAQIQTQVRNASADVRASIRYTSESILVTTSSVLNDETRTDLPRGAWPGLATQMIRAVESSAMQLASTNQNTTNVTGNIVLDVSVYNASADDVTFPRPAILSNTAWNATGDSILLTADTINEITGEGQARLVFVMYKNVASWMQPVPTQQNQTGSNDLECCSPESDENCTVTSFINSLMISATVNEGSAAAVKLKSDVIITLAHAITENVSNPVCVFWNFSEDLETGDWSSDGCRVLATNATHTTCACNHLTNFAILMSPTQPKISAANEFALSLITYFGCVVSILCLILCIITFVAFKSLQCDRNTIHKNLCICLLLANVLFLAGIMQYRTPVLCSVIAGFLHYLFLASFAWMCLEGVQLYVMLVEVFEAERSRIAWYYAAGYGLPAIIVVISAAVYHQGYGTAYSCWLSVDRGFIWAFTGPVLTIITVNCVMLGIAIRAMVRHTRSAAAFKVKEKSKLQQIRLWLKGTIILVFLLGLTWLFGLLFVNAQTIAFAYIFTILNTLQGMFIFVFHCLLNEKVQTEYKKCIRRASCLPESFRTRYGGVGKHGTPSTANSTPNQSSNSSARPFSRLLGNRQRKSSESTSLSKSASGRKSKQVLPVSPDSQRFVSLHAQNVDSGIEDPSSYLEHAQIHIGVSEFSEHEPCSTIEGSTVDTDYLERLETRVSPRTSGQTSPKSYDV